MKKFNLLKEIIIVPKAELLAAINAAKTFGITHAGSIVYPPFTPDQVFIFQGAAERPKVNALTPTRPKTLAEHLGNSYKVVEDDDRLLIKAGGAWQELIGINIAHSLYDDTTGDGIAEFADKALEEMGWHATEFDIPYRDMVEQIETHCDGMLFCIERDEGESYQFSGLGFINDLECAQNTVYEFCKKIVAEKIENDPDYAGDNLTDDEEEAAEFFGAL